MDEDTAYELTIGMVVVFLVFNYLYPGAAFFASLLAIAAMVGAIYLARGCLEWLFGHGHDNFWAGVLFVTILVVCFNGLGLVTKSLGFIAAAAGSCLAVVAKAVAAAA